MNDDEREGDSGSNGSDDQQPATTPSPEPRPGGTEWTQKDNRPESERR